MRKTPLRKQSKSKIATLKRKAWKNFSLWIRKRDSGICYTCGAKNTVMHAGHFVSRTHNSTLFDEKNVKTQCFKCNLYLKGNSAEFASRLLKEIGQEEFDNLIERSRQLKQWTPDELEEIIKRYDC